MKNEREAILPSLELWKEYTREEIFNIFNPNEQYPKGGPWGFRGIAELPNAPGSFVFFVTLGLTISGHKFDEGIDENGVLTWQSQPSQDLKRAQIQNFISHDHLKNTIHLFLRPDKRSGTLFRYFGPVAYLEHDPTKSKPVYFKWQILHWPPDKGIGLPAISKQEEDPAGGLRDTLEFVEKPINTNQTSKKTFNQKTLPTYEANDARNTELGLKGELLVIQWERNYLIQNGRPDLAEQIVHVSAVEGDAAGYDVRSYDLDGTHKYLEVKTTKGSKSTAFFVSPNQLDFSLKNRDKYKLIRIFDFSEDSNSGKAFVLEGHLADYLELTATEYRARVI